MKEDYELAEGAICPFCRTAVAGESPAWIGDPDNTGNGWAHSGCWEHIRAQELISIPGSALGADGKRADDAALGSHFDLVGRVLGRMPGGQSMLEIPTADGPEIIELPGDTHVYESPGGGRWLTPSIPRQFSPK